jgi:peptidoglycan/LPS O-acetylase OafA/YrhL
MSDREDAVLTPPPPALTFQGAAILAPEWMATETPAAQERLIPAASEPASFIPALDGLRGIAILGVLFFHLGLPKCSLGWSGVELFFVLSGFLITRILLKTRDNSNYFRSFYIRRALRIFPIYYLVLIACSVVALRTLTEGRQTLPFYYVYLQTIPQLATQFGVLPMLGHTWTLAIEEQFYLMWPLVVFLVRGPRLLMTMMAMVLGALALRFLSLGFANPFLVDGWLGVQIDALAAGAMIAYASQTLPRRVLQRWLTGCLLLGAFSLGLMVAMAGTTVFWSPRLWGRMWWGPLLISILVLTFGGAVGLTALRHRWTRWLEFRPLMRWGKISYGIYLFHPFTLLLVETTLGRFGHRHNHLLSLTIMLAKLGVTYLAALISWRLIEGPINSLKDRFASDR